MGRLITFADDKGLELDEVIDKVKQLLGLKFSMSLILRFAAFYLQR
jgi:hypothetical protein